MGTLQTSEPNKSEFYRDKFDSQLLGCEAWKLWLYQSIKPEEIAACLQSNAAIDAVFCFTVFDHGNFRALQQAGFDLISVRNTYEMSIATQTNVAAPPAIEMTRASVARERIRQADLEVLADVIGTTSRYYKDQRIERAKCHAVYTTWLNNSLFNGYAADSVLAFQGERLVGIHTVKVKGDVGVIDLIGVMPDLQSVGLGNALLQDGLAIMSERGATRVEVTTENENIAGSRFYQKHGFRLREMQVVWHNVRST